MPPLSELEAAALGCIHVNQPCTAHFVRTQFRVSPSARFSDSAGSVYPMMKRLERRGLVSSSLQRDGQRDVRYYRPTQSGRRALKGWMAPPGDAASMFTHDPLRTRMIYLELLSPRQRVAWLDEVEAALDGMFAIIDEPRPDRVDTGLFFKLANESARRSTHARLEWIRSARRQLKQAGLLTL